MAWENLEAEIAEEFSDARPDVLASAFHAGFGADGRGGNTPDFRSAPLTVLGAAKRVNRANEHRWNRRMLAERRTRYTTRDKNGHYTVRASQHAKPSRLTRVERRTV